MEINTNNQQTITTKVVNGVRQYRLRLRAFVSMGEALLFLFKDSKVHQKSVKWIKNWSECVLLDLKNPTQPATLKKANSSSHKWPPKFL